MKRNRFYRDEKVSWLLVYAGLGQDKEHFRVLRANLRRSIRMVCRVYAILNGPKHGSFSGPLLAKSIFHSDLFHPAIMNRKRLKKLISFIQTNKNNV